MKQQDNEMEVLFQWKNYRSIIKSKQSELLDRITEIFVSFSGRRDPGRDVQIYTLQSSRKAKGKHDKNSVQYLLQRYVNNWKAYINVDSIDQVKDRDNLTITESSAVRTDFDPDSSTQLPSLNKTKVYNYTIDTRAPVL